MKDKQKSLKRKFSIAMLAMASVMCVALGGIIGVIAASMQSVDSSFNIEYSVGQNIAGIVSARYQVGKQTNVDTAEEHSMGQIEFDAVDVAGQNYYNLNGGDITLTPSGTYVKFTYAFKNKGENKFLATLNDSSIAKNVVIIYDEDSSTTIQGENEVWLDRENVISIPVEKGEEVSVSIIVHVNNVNIESAFYRSQIGNGLVWTLAHFE